MKYLLKYQTPSNPIWRAVPEGISTEHDGSGYQGSYNGVPLIYELDPTLIGKQNIYNPWESGKMQSRQRRSYLVEDANGRRTLGSWLFVSRYPNAKRIWQLENISSEYIEPVKVEKPVELKHPSVPEVTQVPTQQPSGKLITKILQPETKYLIPLSVRPYLAKVSNGMPFFKLPSNVSEELFLKAIDSFTNSHPEYKDIKIPTYKDITEQSANPNNSSEEPKYLNDKIDSKKESIIPAHEEKPEDWESVYKDKKFYMYAYPHNHVKLYNIHPDIYEQVLKNLTPDKDGSGFAPVYTLSPKPLTKLKPGEQFNDTSYIYIGNKGGQRDITIFGRSNPNLVSNDEIITENPVNISQLYVQNGKVRAFTVNGYPGIWETRPNENTELLGVTFNPKATYTPFIKTYFKESNFPKDDPNNILYNNYFYADNELGLTRDQWNNYYQTLQNIKNYLDFSSYVSNEDVMKNVPVENFWESKEKPYEQKSEFGKVLADAPKILTTPFKEGAQKVKDTVNKITNFFRFKSGGQINYLNLFK